MSHDELRLRGQTVFTGSERFDFEYPVDGAWWLDDLLIVLFAPMARNERFGQFPNLVAVDETGAQRWVAELPTTTTGDRYYHVESHEPLVVYSFSSFDCEIDPRTGKILHKLFTK